MTDSEVLKWIKSDLGTYIQRALLSFPGNRYNEAWLAGICMRETGGLINKKNVNGTLDAIAIAPLMIGDNSHGYGFTQIDIRSFPDFVKSQDWKDPFKCFWKTIQVLEGKRRYLQAHFPGVAGDSLDHYITAAYNCGEGNEAKVIAQHADPDAYTAAHNYSKSVFLYAGAY